jgi:hypothetical protein
MLVYFISIWPISRPFGTHFSRFGILYPDESGSPGLLTLKSIEFKEHSGGEKMNRKLFSTPPVLFKTKRKTFELTSCQNYFTFKKIY